METMDTSSCIQSQRDLSLVSVTDNIKFSLLRVPWTTPKVQIWRTIGRAPSRQGEKLRAILGDLTGKAGQRGPQKLAFLITGWQLGCPWVVFISGGALVGFLNVESSIYAPRGHTWQRIHILQNLSKKVTKQQQQLTLWRRLSDFQSCHVVLFSMSSFHLMGMEFLFEVMEGSGIR